MQAKYFKLFSIVKHLLIIQAECVRCPWLLAETKVATILGTFFFSYSSYSEGVVIELLDFAWAPN